MWPLCLYRLRFLLPANSRRYTTLCSALLLIYPYTTVDTIPIQWQLCKFFWHTYGTNVNSKTTAWKPVLNLSLPKPSVVCFGKTTTTCISGFDFQPRGRGLPLWFSSLTSHQSRADRDREDVFWWSCFLDPVDELAALPRTHIRESITLAVQKGSFANIILTLGCRFLYSESHIICLRTFFHKVILG